MSPNLFYWEFSTFVECAALTCCKNIILGDLNLHLDKQDVWSQKFNDSLCQYNFTDIIDSPTHIYVHILDILCAGDTFLEAACLKVIGGSPTILPLLSLLTYPSRHHATSSKLIHGKFTG